MATPPKPDPLSQRREKDDNDDFYEEPMCPCEEVEPNSQSEYDVAGEWVTYTGDVDMSIFNRAAWTAKHKLLRDIRSHERNEPLEIRSVLSSSSESSPEHTTPATNLITDHPFAPSAPSLDDLSLDSEPESEIVITQEEITQSNAEAAANYGPHSYWCDNSHHRFPQASGSLVMTRIDIFETPKMPESDEEDAVAGAAEAPIVEIPKQAAANNGDEIAGAVAPIDEVPKQAAANNSYEIAGAEAPFVEIPKQEAFKYEADVAKADAPIAEAAECPAQSENAEIAEAQIIGAAEIMAEASDDEAENQAVVVAIPSDQVEVQD